MTAYRSWGNYPSAEHEVRAVRWRHEALPLEDDHRTVLPYGCGRSYGDCCLNDHGLLLDTRGLNRFIAFDRDAGTLRCEAGVTLAEALELVTPHGWFIPVSPGTKFVTIGGAIANDIHGKNHHRAGTFGCHVVEFELLRSTGERFVCSARQNADLFRATIGGLGLTGLIVWAEIKLCPIASVFLDVETVRMPSLDAFFDLTDESDRDHEYTVAWIDCLATGGALGRGIFIRGNVAPTAPAAPRRRRSVISVPVYAPGWFLNRYTIRCFNELYYRKQWSARRRAQVHYDRFFYPLDSLGNWNRIYGRRGLLQYQCVVPCEPKGEPIREIVRRVAEDGTGSFLAVLKKFGDVASPGIMSFPKKGLTLALDFPNRGGSTLALLDRLDEIVRASGGRVYPGKDARMSAESFAAYYPQWREFEHWTDPRFSSSFWRRVTHG